MRIGIAVLGAIPLAVACGPSLSHPAYVAQPSGALQAVDQAPPPARVEIVPARPSPLAVWVDGQWLWRRGRWAWLTGRWVMPPTDGGYSPWVLVRAGDGKLWYAPGVWRDAHGAEVLPEPRALAMASVEGGSVVGADGQAQTTGPILHEMPRSMQTAASAGAPSSVPASSAAPSASSAWPGAAAAPGAGAVRGPSGGVER